MSVFIEIGYVFLSSGLFNGYAFLFSESFNGDVLCLKRLCVYVGLSFNVKNLFVMGLVNCIDVFFGFFCVDVIFVYIDGVVLMINWVSVLWFVIYLFFVIVLVLKFFIMWVRIFKIVVFIFGIVVVLIFFLVVGRRVKLSCAVFAKSCDEIRVTVRLLLRIVLFLVIMLLWKKLGLILVLYDVFILSVKLVFWFVEKMLFFKINFEVMVELVSKDASAVGLE